MQHCNTEPCNRIQVLYTLNQVFSYHCQNSLCSSLLLQTIAEVLGKKLSDDALHPPRGEEYRGAKFPCMH